MESISSAFYKEAVFTLLVTQYLLDHVMAAIFFSDKSRVIFTFWIMAKYQIRPKHNQAVPSTERRGTTKLFLKNHE